MENEKPIQFDFDFGFQPIEEDLKDDVKPFQENRRLFKFILNSTKAEITIKRFINLIYSTSLAEISMWTLGFLFFVTHPTEYWYIWILSTHLVRSVVGFFLLSRLPRTYEIVEKVNNMPDLKEEDTLDVLEKEIKDTFNKASKENSILLKLYSIITILSSLIDVFLQVTFLVRFGSSTEFIREIIMLFILAMLNCWYLISSQYDLRLLVLYLGRHVAENVGQTG